MAQANRNPRSSVQKRIITIWRYPFHPATSLHIRVYLLKVLDVEIIIVSIIQRKTHPTCRSSRQCRRWPHPWSSKSGLESLFYSCTHVPLVLLRPPKTSFLLPNLTTIFHVDALILSVFSVYFLPRRFSSQLLPVLSSFDVMIINQSVSRNRQPSANNFRHHLKEKCSNSSGKKEKTNLSKSPIHPSIHSFIHSSRARSFPNERSSPHHHYHYHQHFINAIIAIK